ncbi:MAG: endonuclease III [Candidatus Hadarchaeales archaeon]
MRKEKVAEAVVKFLYSNYGEPKHRWKEDPFKVLISCVLSQRTREENTEKASRALFSIASTPKDILKIPEEEIAKIIRPVGFPKQKAKNILKICKILVEKYDGKVPADKEVLKSLPGVGEKTANVTLCYGFGIPCIPVDTHVNRISRRLGLVSWDAKLEEVEPTLRKIFKRKDWRLINLGMVQFGREICLPRNPKCEICPLKKLCLYAKRDQK